MICPCGGSVRYLTFRGEEYPVCNSCGRANPPTCMDIPRRLATHIRSQYNRDAAGKQHVRISAQTAGFDFTDDDVADAISILGEDFNVAAEFGGLLQ